MTLELEGNILLERTHPRRWVSIIAVVIPVAAFVLLAAWFIRAFVAPPTIAISSPMILVDAPAAAPVPAQSVAAKQSRQPLQTVAESIPAASVKETPEPVTGVSALPMFATLTAAPPSLARTPVAYADPAQNPAPAPIMVAEPAIEPEASEPLAGPVPLPRAKPHGPVALVTGAIPLPRSRPTEAAPAPDLPAYDRHSAE